MKPEIDRAEVWPQLETGTMTEPKFGDCYNHLCISLVPKFGHYAICPSPSPSPHHVCPSITAPPILHSSVTPASVRAEDDVFHAAPSGATLTVQSCLVDGRPSLSSSADGHTDYTRISGSDDSPLPDHPLTLATDPDVQVRLVVPSPPIVPQSRDRMPTHRSQRSARVGINFQLATAPRCAPRTAVSNSKRSRRREKKVTKTLAIVLGKRSPYHYLIIIGRWVYRAKSCTSVFLAGKFLFVRSDTFAA